MRQYQYHVYILTNYWRTVLYIGMTGDIEGRVFDHKTKSNKGFTNKYNCDRLVHFEPFKHVCDAIAREKQLKKWRRVWKENLIEENNPNWDDLSEGWYNEKDLTEARQRQRSPKFSSAAVQRVPGASPSATPRNDIS